MATVLQYHQVRILVRIHLYVARGSKDSASTLTSMLHRTSASILHRGWLAKLDRSSGCTV